VKYLEIILENLRDAGWNCGCITTTDGKGRSILVVAAERNDAGRFIVNSDQELPAFLELESAIQAQVRLPGRDLPHCSPCFIGGMDSDQQSRQAIGSS
jgi:hypothetical protein